MFVALVRGGGGEATPPQVRRASRFQARPVLMKMTDMTMWPRFSAFKFLLRLQCHLLHCMPPVAICRVTQEEATQATAAHATEPVSPASIPPSPATPHTEASPGA